MCVCACKCCQLVLCASQLRSAPLRSLQRRVEGSGGQQAIARATGQPSQEVEEQLQSEAAAAGWDEAAPTPVVASTAAKECAQAAAAHDQPHSSCLSTAAGAITPTAQQIHRIRRHKLVLVRKIVIEKNMSRMETKLERQKDERGTPAAAPGARAARQVEQNLIQSIHCSP